MRLRRLELIRYGKFADHALDFGAAEGRASDVTIVFGPNEAGKSTAYAAWLDLLFGLPLQHPYAFRFDRKDLLIGAALDTHAGPLTLRRTGLRTGSLTDENGRVVDEHRLAALLHGLDRANYSTRFSLNDAVLRKGGDEIASAQGDLGQLLHAGTSGVAGVSDRLSEVQKAVDGFHKKGGRSTVLALAKRRLNELATHLKDARLAPQAFDGLRTEQAAAQDALDQIKLDRVRAQHTLAVRQAASDRHLLSKEARRLTDEIATFPTGPDLPEEAVARVTEAATRRTDAKTRQDHLEQRLADARASLATETPDADGLRVADMLVVLEDTQFDDGTNLVSRVIPVATDLPKRQAELAEDQAEAARIARRVAGPDVTSDQLVMSDDHRGHLSSLADDARRAAQRVEDQTRACQELEAELGPDLPMPEHLDDLKEALTGLDRLGDEAAVSVREASLARLAADQAAVGLPPDWSQAVAAGLPSDSVTEDISRRLDQCHRGVTEANKAFAREQQDLSARKAEREAIVQGQDPVTHARQAETRAARDTAWRVHRAELTADTANTFERAMAQDDDIVARFAASAEARAALAAADTAITQQEQRVTQAEVALAHSRADLDAAQTHFTALCLGLLLPDTAPVQAVPERRRALSTAAEAALVAEHADHRASQAADQRRKSLGRIARVLGLAQVSYPDDDPEGMVQLAKRAAARMESEADASRARQAASQSFAAQKAALERQKQVLADATQTFEIAISDMWCAGWSASAYLAAASDLERLTRLDGRQAETRRRMKRMSDAVDAFEAATQGWADMLHLDATVTPTDLLAAAKSRVSVARATQTRIDNLAKQIADVETELQRQSEQIARCSADIAQVLQDQSVPETTPPEQAVRQLVKRDAARAALAEIERQQAGLADPFDPAELAQEEAQIDPSRLAEAQETLDALDAARDAALLRVGQANEAAQQAMARAGGAQLEQQRQVVLTELREEARLAATQLFGLMAARGALKRFRQDRRGDMLAATEHAFERLTHGVWPRLETVSMGASERLMGMREDGPVAADAMSTGTRGQLYLALRVAGHADFVKRNGPLPFVTDDIHETFDNDRALAALELTAEMGRLGQAIVFTHHAHLVDLARTAIPDVRVIDLS